MAFSPQKGTECEVATQRSWIEKSRSLPLMPSRVSVLLVSIALIFSSAASAQTAKIAVAVSLTGAGEPFGGPAVEGARLAVEEANATGEAPRLELEIRDDASNADRAREVAGQVLASDALVVVGPATTPMALAVGPVFADGGIVCIGTTTTGDTVTNAATFFRAIFKTSDVGEALANYLRYILGGTRAIVLLKNDGYGQPVAAGFKGAAERLGIRCRVPTVRHGGAGAGGGPPCRARPRQARHCPRHAQ
jgi:branched-chain amino acid transport system substrate-binding protein